MIINAAVNSKAFTAKFKRANKYGLHELCGHLALDSTSEADAALLTALYKYLFSGSDKAKGSIKVFDNEGAEVAHYYHVPEDGPKWLPWKLSPDSDPA